ncbi:GTPase [Candidatus Bathyarchaeota archaeon]|nr:MAG: GTPase [Candidatus Bathyarchaeota archaeon]
MIIVMLGPAGCGKTSLTAAFGAYLEDLGQEVAYVNLDPGCEELPYEPDFDIRDYFTVAQLMREEKLGPNGAMIRASELMEEHVGAIVKAVRGLEADYTLVDTPGQMEIFVLRPAGPNIVRRLADVRPTVAVFMMDPTTADSFASLVVAKLLALSAQLRLEVPTVLILNKADLLSDGALSEALEDPEALRARIEGEEGLVSDMALTCLEALQAFSQVARLVKVSARTGEGLDALFDLVHEAFCTCGDLS